MVVHSVVVLKHPKKGEYELSYLDFIPDADDITKAQLDYFIKRAKDQMEWNLIPEVVEKGLYKSESSVKRAIKNGTLKFEAVIRVIVDEKLLQESVTEEAKEKKAAQKIHSEALEENKSYVHTIEYNYFHGLENVTRGLLVYQYYLNDYIRQEWSDLQPEQKRYELGDVIRFKFEHGIKEGIICGMRGQDFFETTKDNRYIFANLYEVVVEEKSFTLSSGDKWGEWVRNEYPYTYYWSERDAIHANDIIECLGNDIEKMRRMMREYSYDYTDDYLESIGVITKDNIKS